MAEITRKLLHLLSGTLAADAPAPETDPSAASGVAPAR